MKRIIYPLLAAMSLVLAIGSALATERQLWTDGHGDLHVGYNDGDWIWGVWLNNSPERVAIGLGDAAKVLVPDNPRFDFLGGHGSPLWIAPQIDREGVVFLGINASASLGTFEANRFDLRLMSVSGPGDFFMWNSGGAGTVEIYMNSRDGIGESDRVDMAAPGHFHQNWGFSSPGTYQLGLAGEGRLVGLSTPTRSDVEFVRFAVNVFDRGEIDLEVSYDNGEWELSLLDEANEREIEASDAALHAGPDSWQPVPADSSFAFLGSPGSSIYILPQDENDGILFLGIAGDEIESGIFENDQIALNLSKVDGPGAVYLYSTDEFGVSTQYFNSSDGVGSEDRFPIRVGGHSHQNWAFTAPGIYRITLNASGLLADGGTVASGDTTFLFEVFGPTIIENGELDLEVSFEEGQWDLLGLQEANNQEICASELVIRGSSATRTFVPEDPAFSFLGTPGDPVNVLPQSEAEGAVFLGIAGDEIPTGVFENESVDLQLVGVNGPGEVFLYATDEFGAPTLFFNSADGVAGEDVFAVKVGGHSHQNWGFTESGVYKVSLQASATLELGAERVQSESVDFTFLIDSSPGSLTIEMGLDGSLMLSWPTILGRVYQLESILAFEGMEWVEEGEAFAGDGGVIEVAVSLSEQREARFYRFSEIAAD